MFGNNGMDIYNLIEQSQNIRYGESDVTIDGLPCYEIEGTCKYGKTRILFSSDKGYCPLKWEITKTPGHYFDDKLLDRNIKKWKATFYADEITEISGFYMPLKGHLQHDVLRKTDHLIRTVDACELSNIQVFPDFETVNAFEFDLPSNVPVTLESSPGVRYHFNNGQLCPMIDREN